MNKTPTMTSSTATQQEINSFVMAAGDGKIKVIEEFLRVHSGYDLIDAPADSKMTALGSAAMWHRLEMIEYLLNNLASINALDKEGQTALMWGAQRGSIEVVELLLQRGAKVDVQNNGGQTALILASIRGHKDIVKALLTAGASTEIMDFKNRSAIDWARSINRPEVIVVLEGHETELQRKRDLRKAEEAAVSATDKRIKALKTIKPKSPFLKM